MGLEEITIAMLKNKQERNVKMKWDVFICHASEDKESIVRPLAYELEKAGVRVWYDEFTLSIGDSLRRSIDRGIAESRFGIVVLSPAFFSREWPQYELDGLTQKDMLGSKVILPVWHQVSHKEVMSYSPSLADKISIPTSKGLRVVVSLILSVVHSSSKPVSQEQGAKTEQSPEKMVKNTLDILAGLESEFRNYDDITRDTEESK